MADRQLIVRLIMRIADFPEELARMILGELTLKRGMLITTPTFGVPRPAPIFPYWYELPGSTRAAGLFNRGPRRTIQRPTWGYLQ